MALRALPSVDELLGHERIAALMPKAGRPVVIATIRSVLAETRRQITAPTGERGTSGVDLAADSNLESRVISEVENFLLPSLAAGD